MSPSADILILGGGVIGLTTAYFLAREGIKVEVVDQADFGQEASWAGAGILPPGNPARARSAYDQLRALGAQLHPDLAAELRDRTGIDNGYLRCGGLEFFSEDDGYVEAAWREEGIAFEKLDETSTQRLEPALGAGLGGAFLLPDLAQVRNPRHLKALLAACTALGVRLRRGCPVHAFDRKASRIAGVHSAQGLLHADRYLIATGAWTAALLEPFGLRPGIKPVRGQIVLLNTGAPSLRRVLMAGLCYLVPRADGRVLIGSTEEDAGFDRRTTAGAIGQLLAFARERVPSLADANLERCWAGLRPGSPDGLPFLAPVPEVDNLFVAAGHFRAGIQLSPATALVMKELMLGQTPSVALDAFRVNRTPAPRQRVAFRS